MKHKNLLPSQLFLLSIFEYRNGKLFWKQKTSNLSRIQIGDEAGTLDNDGYLKVTINRVNYQVHNIIWKMLTGNDPVGEIDHIEKSYPKDNRIENLRDVSHQENCKNKAKNKNNTSGHTDICIRENRLKKYQVRIRHNKKEYQKSFYILEEAIQHRNEKYVEFGFHLNHGI